MGVKELVLNIGSLAKEVDVIGFNDDFNLIESVSRIGTGLEIHSDLMINNLETKV